MLFLTVLTACKEEINLHFSEAHIDLSNDVIIAINYPKAEGSEGVSKAINTVLDDYIIQEMNMTEDQSSRASVDDAINEFRNSYQRFQSDFPETSAPWELLIDGEVTFESPQLVSIAMNAYSNTGGAHGNTTIRFFNFNSQTGALLTQEQLISDVQGLSELVQKELMRDLKSNAENEPMENFFFGEAFQLPESIGFSDEGLIILYNPYEIASYAQGIIEFTIPYEDVEDYINIF